MELTRHRHVLASTLAGDGTGRTLPSSFTWSSSGVLISPKSDSTHNLIAVKDPSVGSYNGRWYVYMSTVDSNGNYGMATINFSQFPTGFGNGSNTSLSGSWSPHATDSDPFLSATDVTFPSGAAAWSQDFSGGEAIRSGYDQNDTLSPWHLQYLYQGHDPSANQSYNLLPWWIGLATQTNSEC